MDRYFTVMIIPEREKGVRSFRVPRIVFHAVLVLLVIFIFLLAVLSYDYKKILGQVYENKHLTIENRQLKEQIQLFQMKVNSLTEDIDRINVFEKKLRVITGIDLMPSTPLGPSSGGGEPMEKTPQEVHPEGPGGIEAKDLKPQSSAPTIPMPGETQKSPQPPASVDRGNPANVRENSEFIKLKNLYEQKIATTFGLSTGYEYTKEWSALTKRSFGLAESFAFFDFQFNSVKKKVSQMEVEIHELDQYLLDKDSFLKSTPTLLPSQGWITSYYAPRVSFYSGRIKMHEGLDIGADMGTPIIAPADGMVTFSGNKPGFGRFVQVDHGYGVETIYAHANTLQVLAGQKVKRGDMLARVGNTGYSTGPHLHYEVRVNGTPVDPLYYILD